MQFKTKVVITAVVSIPIATLTGVGLGATIFIVQEETNKRKSETPKSNPNGPKIEKIKSNRKRTKTYKAFDEIIDRY